MSTNLDGLRRNLERARETLSWIENELNRMDSDPKCDHSYRIKLIRDKIDVECLINDIEKRILAEERQCGTKPGEQESPSQEIYRTKNKSYGVMRMNYGTLDNNL